jgi:type I restriction enzyme S subunit
VISTRLPPPEEQQKIADCLASLDDLIRAQGEKIEALKQHKKGLMQRLFPQEVA